MSYLNRHFPTMQSNEFERLNPVILAPPHNMKITSLVLAALLPAGTAALRAAEAASLRPNILLVVSDDQGYADTGFQGCRDIPTPHLDRLAGAGLRCSNGYVTHAFCSPSRAALLTGRYQQRFGHENNPFYDPNDHREGLPTTEKLLPQFLCDAGYVTGWIGKWHLGAAPEFRPQNRGFTETFGFLGGGHHYLNWKVEPRPSGREYNIPIERNGQPVEVTNHLTLAFGDEGAAFVRRHQGESWFLYLAFNAPHTPNEPTPERLARFASIPNPNRRAYAAQVSLLDDAIGNVLAALRETGQERRTLVFFFSDNGGPIMTNGWNGSSNLPLRGGKGELYEGGIRVPFVVSWPGKLAAGRAYDLPVSSLDVFPTALALAGVALPTNRPLDGVNLLPFLAGANTNAPHPRLFWRLGGGNQLATRASQLKLIRFRHQPEALFDLAADLGETKDLSGVRATEAQQLGAALDDWNKTLVPPAFPGLAGRASRSKATNPLVEP
jgi:arylsulfatase A-like enzyme